MPELAAEMIISQRYRLDRMLGEGGMGEVWAATHLITRKSVALKFLKHVDTQSPSVTRRFLREARAASAVRHPNVAQVHDVIQLEDGQPVMVMDLLVGESLGQRLTREGVLPLPELARILVPVLSAVGTAHAVGIVHRDLKPDNIFLHQGPQGIEPKVLDFGIAKLTALEGEAAQTGNLTRTGAMLGTPYYMSPEQVFGEKDIDQRADIWSLGVILYECSSGVRPVDGENIGQLFKVITTGHIAPLERVAPHVPQDVTALVNRMLATERARRPWDLREVYETLRRYTSAQATSFNQAVRPVAFDTGGQSSTGDSSALGVTASRTDSRRVPRRWILAGVAGVAGAIALAAPLWLRSSPSDNPAATGAASESAQPVRPLPPASVRETVAAPAEVAGSAAPSAAHSASLGKPPPITARGRPPLVASDRPAPIAPERPPPHPDTPPPEPVRQRGTVVSSVPF
jgi:serine/threonine protein kinase